MSSRILLLALTGMMMASGCIVATRSGPPPGDPTSVGTEPGGESYPRYVEGTVTDARTKLPLARASIDITAPSTGKLEATVSTDADGNYRTKELPLGEFNIRVRREGYETVTRLTNITDSPARLDVAMTPKR